MYALLSPNNEIVQIGPLTALFPNDPKPTYLTAMAHGAKEVIEGHREDERFYWVTFDKYEITGDTVTRQYISTPKQLEDVPAVDTNNNPIMVQIFDPTANNGAGGMVDTSEQVITTGLKTQFINQFKHTARTLLAETDWMVIRKAERNIDIPTIVATKRNNIITECDRLIAAASAATDMPSFIVAVQSANWS